MKCTGDSVTQASATAVHQLIVEAGIDASLCVLRQNTRLPLSGTLSRLQRRPFFEKQQYNILSVAVVSNATGSRTILHAPNDFNEVTIGEFKTLVPDLSEYAWVHFEGRNFDAVNAMMSYCIEKRSRERPMISVEAEKVEHEMQS